MESKICFKCGVLKPLSEFYKHPKTADGHLGKCKDCTKRDSRSEYQKKAQYPEWVEKERARGREKHKRLGYGRRYTKTTRLCPEETGIARKLRRRGYDTTGKEAHHWNYNEPYSVFLVSRKTHALLHGFITVNYEDKFCYTTEGARLETAEQAEAYFNGVLERAGIAERLSVININTIRKAV